MEGYGEPREREQPPEPPMDWEKAVALYPCAVILGDPGFGKSWLLRYEARRLARQALTQLDTGATLDEIQLPILTRLADVARAAKTGTVTAALAALASRSTQDDALSDSFHAWVVQHLQMGRCAVLLDAWDEVAEASALQDGVLSRAELADKLSHFSAPRILFTSRGAGYTGSPITGAQELELIAFEQNQIEQFVQVWFDGEPDGSARFLALLEDLPPVRGLARIPLMLSLLIRMFTAKPAEDFPQTRCEIYEQCLRGLLQDWKEEKQPGVEIQDADAMLEALSAIAFALPIEQGAFKRSFLWQQIRQWLGELRSGDSCYGKQPETIILRLLQDGILIKVNDERDPDYLFLHRTFHEYLTACALAQRQDWLEQALQKIYDPAWLQALILLGGKLKTREPAERYIDALRNEQCPNTFFNRLRFPLRRRYKDIFFRPFILAVFAAQEARETLSEQTKNKILDETLRLWRDPPDWLDREWFLNALLSWNKRACPALRVLLRDERVDAGVRGEVAHSLAMLQDRESLPDLRALLRDERMDALRGRWVDASARGKVARSLATLQDRESLPDLRALLRDERANEWLRSTVARSLATLQDRESLPDLRALLADKRMMAHPGVAEALVRLQDRESLPDIRALLRDERIDSTARRLVAEALVSLQDRESLPDIRALLRDERMSSTARRLVAKALVSLQDRESLPDLRALLRDERMERDSVAQFLATLQDRESLPDLRALLRDGRVFAPVRGSVAQALATLQDRESLPDIRALLRDERMEASVRGELAQSLATLQDRESLPDLRALLRDERVDAYLRVTVAKALVSLQDRESLPEILTLLRNDRVNAYLRVTVAYALVTLQDREFLPDLRALLRDDRANAWLRVTVALVLATFQDLESLPDILTVLRDWRVYAWLRRAVALVLAMLQNRESLRDLRARLSDERVGLGTRHEALNALWRLAQAEKIPIRFE
jgi:HEAT repeat protein